MTSMGACENADFQWKHWLLDAQSAGDKPAVAIYHVCDDFMEQTTTHYTHRTIPDVFANLNIVAE